VQILTAGPFLTSLIDHLGNFGKQAPPSCLLSQAGSLWQYLRESLGVEGWQTADHGAQTPKSSHQETKIPFPMPREPGTLSQISEHVTVHLQLTADMTSLKRLNNAQQRTHQKANEKIPGCKQKTGVL
jgi:hypothetical protein